MKRLVAVENLAACVRPSERRSTLFCHKYRASLHTTTPGITFKANTICLPFDEKLKEKYLDIDVTIVGWGYTEVQGNRGMLNLTLSSVQFF